MIYQIELSYVFWGASKRVICLFGHVSSKLFNSINILKRSYFVILQLETSTKHKNLLKFHMCNKNYLFVPRYFFIFLPLTLQYFGVFFKLFHLSLLLLHHLLIFLLRFYLITYLKPIKKIIKCGLNYSAWPSMEYTQF